MELRVRRTTSQHGLKSAIVQPSRRILQATMTLKPMTAVSELTDRHRLSSLAEMARGRLLEHSDIGGGSGALNIT